MSRYTHPDLHISKEEPDLEPAEVLHDIWNNGNRSSVVLHLLELTADRPGYGLATTAYFTSELSNEEFDIFHALLPEDA